MTTTFATGPHVQALPLRIFANLLRTAHASVVDVVPAVLAIVAIVPVRITKRLSGDSLASRV